MADDLLIADEAEFAGYVDSGIWALEEWLGRKRAQQRQLERFLKELWADLYG